MTTVKKASRVTPKGIPATRLTDLPDLIEVQKKSFEQFLKEGLKENKCELCGISEWNGKPLVMQLHHIDGNNKNNSLENLQLLCPNCHSQTENYCGNSNEKSHNYCKDCGKEISRKATYCTQCLSKHRRKVERPSEKELIESFKTHKSFLSMSKTYGVSDKTISKWFIGYGYTGKAKELKELFLK